MGADGLVGRRTWEQLAEALERSGHAAGKSHETPAPQSDGAWALSHAGTSFIAQFEGFRGKLYNDAAGHCTIGFGHLVHRGATNGSEPAEFKAGVSRRRALGLLEADGGKAAAAVTSSVSVPLTQPQFDALVSFVFKLGAGNLQKSTLLH